MPDLRRSPRLVHMLGGMPARLRHSRSWLLLAAIAGAHVVLAMAAAAADGNDGPDGRLGGYSVLAPAGNSPEVANAWPAGSPLDLPPPPQHETIAYPWGPPLPEASPFALSEPFQTTDDAWWDSSLAPLPTTAFTFAWLGSGNGWGGFGTLDFDLNRTWQWHVADFGNPVLVTPGVGLHFWSGPRRLDLPPRVYDLYLDLSWRFLEREWWGVAGGLTPGFYGDFGRLDGDAFQLTGWLLGDWTLNERWSVLAGLAYVQQLRSNLLPIGGVIWRPTPDARFDIVVPRPRIAHRWFEDGEKDVWFYVGGLFGGGAWAVDAGNENILVQYSDFRLTLGCEIARTGGRLTTLEIGYVFNREIALERYVVSRPSGTLMLSAAVAF